MTGSLSFESHICDTRWASNGCMFFHIILNHMINFLLQQMQYIFGAFLQSKHQKAFFYLSRTKQLKVDY